MQLALLILISLTYLADDATTWTPWSVTLDPWEAVGLSLANVFLLNLAVTIGLIFGTRALRRSGSWRTIQWSDALLRMNLWAVLLVHAFNIIVLGWLDAVRALMGDVWIVDECAAMAPPLLAWIAGWAAYYPIHRHILERLLIRQLDRGEPVYPIQSRLWYALSQAQLHLGLILAPAMLILGWVEGVDQAWRASGLESGSGMGWVPECIMALGVVIIFLLAPMILTTIWSTAPLARGELRDRLDDLLKRHGVRLRNILVWNTNGTMINGAILGVFARIRYVLLSDALLDSMKTPEIEAVMAHEVGHAKHHHLPWLALSLMASFAIGSFMMETALSVLPADEPVPQNMFERFASQQAEGATSAPPWTLGPTLAFGLLVFGWVSRRFERQADTFAAQHLSGAIDGDGGAKSITADAAHTMAGALGRIAALNHIQPRRRSWRHGSIAWRQEYLNSLVGQDSGRLAIDRTVRVLKISTMIVLLAAGGIALWQGGANW